LQPPELVSARAASLLAAVLLLVKDRVESLNERRAEGLAGGKCASIVGLNHSHLSGGGVASAASSRGSSGIISVALGFLALQFALRTSAVGGLDALLAAVQLLANRSALGLRSHAGSVASGWLADGLASVASGQFASILGASNRADWALAMNGALSARYLLAFHFALRSGANRVAYSRALGVIAHPLAHWVARSVDRQGHRILGRGQGGTKKQHSKNESHG